MFCFQRVGCQGLVPFSYGYSLQVVLCLVTIVVWDLGVEEFRQRVGRARIWVSCGWLSKLGSLFGSLIEYGTDYLGYPKRDPNTDTDNHPCMYRKCGFEA